MLLGEGDVVDPVGVCLGLGAETGRALRVSVGLRGGVDDGRVVGDQVAVEVPGANYAVATSRVAVSRGVSMGPWGIVAHGGLGEDGSSHRMALSRSTARPLTPRRWPPGDAFGRSSTAESRRSSGQRCAPFSMPSGQHGRGGRARGGEVGSTALSLARRRPLCGVCCTGETSRSTAASRQGTDREADEDNEQ